MSKNRTDRVIVSPSPQTVSPAKHLLRFLSLWRCRFKIKSTRKLLHNLRRVVYSFSSIMWQFTGFYSANHMVWKIVYKKQTYLLFHHLFNRSFNLFAFSIFNSSASARRRRFVIAHHRLSHPWHCQRVVGGDGETNCNLLHMVIWSYRYSFALKDCCTCNISVFRGIIFLKAIGWMN